MATKKQSKFAGKPAFARLREHLEIPESKRGVGWEHQLGSLVDQLCPRGKRGYGQGNIELLAKELGEAYMSANRLWAARKLAAAISSTELDDLMRQVQREGFKLSASHVLAVATIKDEGDRLSVGQQCIERKWNVQRLRHEIHKLQGKKSKGGLKLSEPESVDDALWDLLDRSREWLHRYKHLWFADKTGKLARPMSKATATRLVDELGEAEEVLKELESATDHARRCLSQHRKKAAKKRQPGATNSPSRKTGRKPQ